MGVPSARRSCKYRFYPTDAQAVERSRTFGRLRSVRPVRGSAPGRYGNAAIVLPAAGAAVAGGAGAGAHRESSSRAGRFVAERGSSRVSLGLAPVGGGEEAEWFTLTRVGCVFVMAGPGGSPGAPAACRSGPWRVPGG
ncbi:helix-turn-helix domain-containing protein [Streptomyces erythrochromogenes]|nr:helix-turn-helix domain-containing protein [Streptomyces erythrochromogenes]